MPKSTSGTPTGIRVSPDSKSRIVLGSLAQGVSTFRMIREEASGRIILEPYVEIPAREAWLHENPEAMASLVRGIGEAERGETVSRGSFAKDLT